MLSTQHTAVPMPGLFALHCAGREAKCCIASADRPQSVGWDGCSHCRRSCAPGLAEGGAESLHGEDLGRKRASSGEGFFVPRRGAKGAQPRQKTGFKQKCVLGAGISSRL